MLSLMDPVEMDDLVVFRDDEDPRKFYLLPDQPVIALEEDGEPEFLFIKYIKDLDTLVEGQDIGAGWIQFRTVLGIDAARRRRVTDALRVRLEQEKADGKKPLGLAIASTEPLLAAPLWTKGKANLATFKVGDTGLVRHATESVEVDLAGDLGASFGLELDRNGSDIFWGSFKDYGEQVPLLITYQLSYKARVSARMTIKARRDVVHRQIWEQARPYRLLAQGFPRYVPVAHQGPLTAVALVALKAQWGVPIACMVERPQIQQAIRQTIVNNKIDVRIETDQAGGGEEEAKVRDLMFKVATDVLSDRLIPALFGTAPGQPGAASEQDPRATKELIQVRESDSSGEATFELSLDHQTTIERSVSPNGPIQLAVANPSVLTHCFKELRLSDESIKEMRVVASTAGVNFERDGIASIQVWLKYSQVDERHPARILVERSTDGVLKSETEALRWRFDSVRAANGAPKRTYDYATEVVYREGTRTGQSASRPSTNQALVITPRAMGALRVELELTAPKPVDGARVALRHRAPSGRDFETELELNAGKPRRTWFQFTGEPAEPGAPPPAYSYRVRYAVGTGEIQTPWTETTAQVLEIPSPFRRTLVFTVRPQGSFEGVSSIDGDISYEDARRGYRITRAFHLARLTDAFPFEVPVLEGGPEVASWTGRVSYADGSHLELDPGQGPPGTVWVGKATNAFTVQIVADLLDFETDVQLAVVELSYADPAHAIAERETLTFSKTAKQPRSWRVPRQDPALGKYDAKIRYIAYDRTKNSEVQLRQIEDQVLVLDRAQG